MNWKIMLDKSLTLLNHLRDKSLPLIELILLAKTDGFPMT
jgi:hypothetical protein